MLKIEHLQSGYGHTPVLFGLNLALREGQVVTLMGRNGMGKTTTIGTVMGQIRTSGGRVVFAGADITGSAPELVARRGIGLVPEGRHIFPTLTVRENLIATAANRLGAARPWTLARVIALFPRLGERQEQLAGTLSGGEQQMLAIARVLVGEPKLLLIDEPTEGLAPMIVDELFTLIGNLASEGIPIVLVEQNVHRAIGLVNRFYMLERGSVVLDGGANQADRSALMERLAV